MFEQVTLQPEQDMLDAASVLRHLHHDLGCPAVQVHAFTDGRTAVRTSLKRPDRPLVALVGGILASAGVEGFLADRDEPVDAVSPEEEAWQGFVVRWAEVHGDAEVDGRILLALALETGLWTPDPRAGAELVRFGIALARRRDRVFGGWRIRVRRDAKRKQNVYALSSTAK